MNTRYITLAVLALALSLGGCNTPNRPSPTPPPPNKTEKEGQTSEKGKPAVKDSIPTDATPKDTLPKGKEKPSVFPPAPMPENYGDNRVMAPRNSPELHHKLLTIGRDGEIHDLTYHANTANIEAYWALQQEALREMLQPNNVVDPGGPPAYGANNTPIPNYKRCMGK